MQFDIVIVGAGPAGLAAAATAAEAGLKVALIDDQARVGGQYYRHAPVTPKAYFFAPKFGKAKQVSTYEDIFARLNVVVFSESSIIDVTRDKQVKFVSNGKLGILAANAIVVATGARERILPFPGWTTPGVMGAGAAHNLMKSSGVAPGKRVLVSGGGPLSLLVACNLVRSGVEVVGVCAASRNSLSFKSTLKLLLRLDILLRGLGYLALLHAFRVPILRDHKIRNVIGIEQVEGAEIVPSNNKRQDARRISADVIIVNDGLLPNIEILSRLGCEFLWSDHARCLLPVRDATFQTSVPGIYAVGDCANVSGFENATLEGKIVALSLATVKDKALSSFRRTQRQLGQLRGSWDKLQRFRESIQALFNPSMLDVDGLPPSTIVCRCEDVSVGALNNLLREGVIELSALKSETRIGMGRCQGRNCSNTIVELVVDFTSKKPSEIAFPTVRLPLKPVRVADLLD